MAQQSIANGGHIHLRIISGNNLIIRDTHLFSENSSDPYVKIKSGGSRNIGQTKVITQNLCPVWDEQFNFDIEPGESPSVLLEIFDKDTFKRDDPMGVVTISLSSILENKHKAIEKEYVIEQCEGATEIDLGTIKLFISFDPFVPEPIKDDDIIELTSSSLFRVGLGWDVEPMKKKLEGEECSSELKPRVDLDASAVVFDSQGQLLEAIYFDKLASTDLCGTGAIVHFDDCRTGDTVVGGDDETIQIDLSKLNPEVLAIFICVCAFSDGTSFTDLVNASCRVYDNNDINMLECHLGKLGPRTAVTMVRIFRDPMGGGWKMGSLFAMDSMARSWEFLIPQFKNNLGTDLVPGLVGHNRDRIAISSKDQSFKIADRCDTIQPGNLFCVGLNWDPSSNKNVDLDASILLLNNSLTMIDWVAYDHIKTTNSSLVLSGDVRTARPGDDNETIMMDLSKIPKDCSYLCVLVNSHKRHDLSSVQGAKCHIIDFKLNRDICKINLTGEKSMDGKTCCFVACFFKVNNSWWIKSTNEGMMGVAYNQSYPFVKKYLENAELILKKTKDITMQQTVIQHFIESKLPPSPATTTSDPLVDPTTLVDQTGAASSSPAVPAPITRADIVRGALLIVFFLLLVLSQF